MLKSFSDWNGETMEIQGFIQGIEDEIFARLFPGVKGIRFDRGRKQAGRSADGRWVPVTRKVNYSDNPSRHQCDDRCKFARKSDRYCECACGGRNHGKGNR